MQYSKYQTDIFDFIKTGIDNSAIMAVAGAAKTTTAVQAMEYIPKIKDTLFTTFGREIADDLARKTKHLINVTCSNYNSFGWHICLDQMPSKPKLDVNKTDNILKFGFFKNLENGQDRERYYKYKNIIGKLVSSFKSMNLHSVDDIVKILPWLLERHDYDIPQDDWFNEVLFGAFKSSISNTVVFDFDDQKFMPLHLGLDIPKFDVIIIDEFQDSNELESQLMFAASKGRMIVVGDRDQSIYGFRHATPDAMDKFINEMNAKILPLNVCYRCSKSVVDEARSIVPHIEAWDQSPVGSVDTIKKDKCVKIVGQDDFVLCRTTVPLVKFCLGRIREGQASYVKGRDLGTNLIQLIDKVPNSAYLPIGRFNDELHAYVMKRMEDLSRLQRDYSYIEDQSDTIDVIIEGCQSVSDLKSKINSIFKDAGNGLCCMTIHKSKGMEKNNIFVLRPDLIPHPKAKKEWQQSEEKRLKYVAITRAKQNLYYVEKDRDER